MPWAAAHTQSPTTGDLDRIDRSLTAAGIPPAVGSLARRVDTAIGELYRLRSLEVAVDTSLTALEGML